MVSHDRALNPHNTTVPTLPAFSYIFFIYINVVARTGTACPLGQRRHGRMVPRVGGTTRLRPEMVFEGGKWW